MNAVAKHLARAFVAGAAGYELSEITSNKEQIEYIKEEEDNDTDIISIVIAFFHFHHWCLCYHQELFKL